MFYFIEPIKPTTVPILTTVVEDTSGKLNAGEQNTPRNSVGVAVGISVSLICMICIGILVAFLVFR